MLSTERWRSNTRRLRRSPNALSRRAPHLLWTLVALNGHTREIAIACWSTIASRTHVVSLLCSQDELFESDAETLCALSAAAGDTDLMTHARWLKRPRSSNHSPVLSPLQAVVLKLADSLGSEISRAERRELGLLYVSLLLFSFIETKGWLNGDFGFLSNGYSRCISEGGRYQQKVLEPLFFGTLNTAEKARSVRARSFGRIPFLNGGLFARSHLEKQRRGSLFTDESFGNAYGSLLSHYRFSGREDSADWSEASIDPEMLIKAFEALMASKGPQEHGRVLHPQALVEEVVGRALDSMFPLRREARNLCPLRASERWRDFRHQSSRSCLRVRTFLVHVLERIASLPWSVAKAARSPGVRRRVLMTSIFGVDLNPMAVWLCELRLWLSIVIESDDGDPMRVVPLPNLDRHIRVGDSLAGGAFDNRCGSAVDEADEPPQSLHAGPADLKACTLARAMDREERDKHQHATARRARLTAIRKSFSSRCEQGSLRR